MMKHYVVYFLTLAFVFVVPHIVARSMKNETGKDFFDEFTDESGKDVNESFNPDSEIFSANFLEEVER